MQKQGGSHVYYILPGTSVLYRVYRCYILPGTSVLYRVYRCSWQLQTLEASISFIPVENVFPDLTAGASSPPLLVMVV